jgi:hypothetical protein
MPNGPHFSFLSCCASAAGEKKQLSLSHTQVNLTMISVTIGTHQWFIPILTSMILNQIWIPMIPQMIMWFEMTSVTLSNTYVNDFPNRNIIPLWFKICGVYIYICIYIYYILYICMYIYIYLDQLTSWFPAQTSTSRDDLQVSDPRSARDPDRCGHRRVPRRATGICAAKAGLGPGWEKPTWGNDAMWDGKRWKSWNINIEHI